MKQTSLYEIVSALQLTIYDKTISPIDFYPYKQTWKSSEERESPNILKNEFGAWYLCILLCSLLKALYCTAFEEQICKTWHFTHFRTCKPMTRKIIYCTIGKDSRHYHSINQSHSQLDAKYSFLLLIMNFKTAVSKQCCILPVV